MRQSKKQFKVLNLAIAVLGLAGFLAVGQTWASYSDIGSSATNIWSAGTLDLEFDSPADFAPEVEPTQVANRTINLLNLGSFAPSYKLSIENIGGDLGLCEKLNFNLAVDGVNVYSGVLADFALASSTLATSTNAVLTWEASLLSEEPTLWIKTCSFDLRVDGWQASRPDASQGFSDNAVIANNVNSGTWGVVLNEILPNPLGDDGAAMPNGEWVELYNNDDVAHDLNGWRLQDLANHKIYITAANTDLATTVIGAKDWLVVYLEQAVLNNSGGDTVVLVDEVDDFQDIYTYTTDAPEDKSYARIPDGYGDWVDPVPTPGRPNRVSAEEETFSEPVVAAPIIADIIGTSTEPTAAPMTASPVIAPIEEPAAFVAPAPASASATATTAPATATSATAPVAEVLTVAEETEETTEVTETEETTEEITVEEAVVIEEATIEALVIEEITTNEVATTIAMVAEEVVAEETRAETLIVPVAEVAEVSVPVADAGPAIEPASVVAPIAESAPIESAPAEPAPTE